MNWNVNEFDSSGRGICYSAMNYSFSYDESQLPFNEISDQDLAELRTVLLSESVDNDHPSSDGAFQSVTMCTDYSHDYCTPSVSYPTMESPLPFGTTDFDDTDSLNPLDVYDLNGLESCTSTEMTNLDPAPSLRPITSQRELQRAFDDLTSKPTDPIGKVTILFGCQHP